MWSEYRAVCSWNLGIPRNPSAIVLTSCPALPSAALSLCFSRNSLYSAWIVVSSSAMCMWRNFIHSGSESLSSTCEQECRWECG